MKISGLQKMTLLDFPGKVACTLFTGGCNLRCPFCHNGGLVRTPAQHPNAEAEVLSYLSRRQGILDGVCITGGEPLMQPDIVDFVKKIKALGLAVKIDTNGTYPERLRVLIEAGLVDYVAMDIKNAKSKYAATCGVGNPHLDKVEEPSLRRGAIIISHLAMRLR